MGRGLAKKELSKKIKKIEIEIEIYKSKKRERKKMFFYLGKAAVAPPPIYCLVYIAFFLSKAR